MRAAGGGDYAGDVRRAGHRAGGRGSEKEVRSGASPADPLDLCRLLHSTLVINPIPI